MFVSLVDCQLCDEGAIVSTTAYHSAQYIVGSQQTFNE